MRKPDYKWVMLALVSAAYFLAQGTRNVYGAVLPSIGSDLGLSNAARGAVATAFFATFGLMIPFAGFFADFFRRKWTIVAGMAIFSLAVLITGFANGFWMLLLVYGVMNAAGQCLMPPSNSSLIGQLHVETRSRSLHSSVRSSSSAHVTSRLKRIGCSMTSYSNLCSFDNRVALVTGAAGNIGIAVCRRLAAHGVRIAACDLKGEAVAARMASLVAEGADIRAYAMDVTSRDSVFSAVAAAKADFGKIDVLVNNAGVWEHRDVQGRQHFEEMDPAEWKRLMEIDVDGVFHVTQAVLPELVKNGYGRIVNLTSIAGEAGLPGYRRRSERNFAGVVLASQTAGKERTMGPV